MVCDNLTDDDNATKLKQELRAISANKRRRETKTRRKCYGENKNTKNELLHKK